MLSAKYLNFSDKLLSLVLPMLLIILALIGYIYINYPHNVVAPERVPSIVVRQVQNVSELTTAIVNTEAIVPVNNKGFLGTESKLLYVASGQARVGIDLSELKTDNVQVDGNKVTVTLPPLRVLDTKLDIEHSYVYSFDRGFLGWGPDVVKLQADAEKKAVARVEAAAGANWVIGGANERLSKTIDQILSQVLLEKGYKEIIVKTQEPALKIYTKDEIEKPEEGNSLDYSSNILKGLFNSMPTK